MSVVLSLPNLDLRRGECRLGLPEVVRVALTESVSAAHLYPIEFREKAEQAAADLLGRPRQEVVLVGGVDEAVDHFLEFYQCLATVVLRPGFSGFRERIALRGPPPSEITVHSTGEIDDCMEFGPAHKILLSSPHNPWGCSIRHDSLRRVVAAAGASLVDRTYRALESTQDPPERWLDGSSLVYYYSFSKVPGLAGLRAGVVCAGEAFTSWLRKRQRYCTLSVPTCAAVRAACAPGVVDEQARRIAEVRGRFVSGLRDLGYDVQPSETTFVLLPVPPGRDLRAALSVAGVLVRDGAELGVAGYLRIGVGTDHENGRLLDALPSIGKETGSDRER